LDCGRFETGALSDKFARKHEIYRVEDSRLLALTIVSADPGNGKRTSNEICLHARTSIASFEDPKNHE
jgi:hypothetical protein